MINDTNEIKESLTSNTEMGPEPFNEGEKTEPKTKCTDLSAELKQKLKENKVLQNKNAKLQTRYVQIFRQQKVLKHENQVFNQFFTHHFETFKPENEESLQIRNLQAALEKRDQIIRQKIRHQMVEQKENQKKQVENKITALLQQKIKLIELRYRKDMDNWSKEIDSFRRQNKVLIEQRKEVENRVLQKDEQISGLIKQKLKMEHRINSERMNEIKEEMVRIEDNSEKFNEREEIIKLSDQICNLMEKRDNLRDELKKAKEETIKLTFLLEQKNQTINILNKKMLLAIEEKEQNQILLKEKNWVDEQKENIPKFQKITDKMEQYEEDIFHEDEDYVHREYMKNVLLRYMKCIKTGDAIHAQILLNVVFTILKFNEEEKQWANTKKKSWWII